MNRLSIQAKNRCSVRIRQARSAYRASMRRYPSINDGERHRIVMAILQPSEHDRPRKPVRFPKQMIVAIPPPRPRRSFAWSAGAGTAAIGAIDTYARSLVMQTISALVSRHPQLYVSVQALPAAAIDQVLVEMNWTSACRSPICRMRTSSRERCASNGWRGCVDPPVARSGRPPACGKWRRRSRTMACRASPRRAGVAARPSSLPRSVLKKRCRERSARPASTCRTTIRYAHRSHRGLRAPESANGILNTRAPRNGGGADAHARPCTRDHPAPHTARGIRARALGQR